MGYWKPTESVSPLEITYGSLMCQRGIYGVCLNDSCQSALENLLHSFQPVIRSVIGTLKVEESFIEDKDGVIRSNRQAVALMPKDIDQRIVIIFADTIDQKNSNNELQSAIDALLKLGAINENIIVLSLIASSKACISLIGRFEKINIWTASIDKLTNSSKLIPGIGRFENRYKMNKKKKKKKRRSSNTSSTLSSTQTQMSKEKKIDDEMTEDQANDEEKHANTKANESIEVSPSDELSTNEKEIQNEDFAQSNGID